MQSNLVDGTETYPMATRNLPHGYMKLAVISQFACNFSKVTEVVSIFRIEISNNMSLVVLRNKQKTHVLTQIICRQNVEYSCTWIVHFTAV